MDILQVLFFPVQDPLQVTHPGAMCSSRICLDTDGSYLRAAGMSGGSGLQFIKAGMLRATFYL